MPSAVAMPLEKSQVPPPQLSSATLTPGPRAARFVDLYSKTLSTTLRTVSYENFSACFPTIAAKAPENLRGLHKAMIERLERFAKKDFEELIKERNVIEHLNALEELIADAQRRKARSIEGDIPPTPPHLLPPSAILAAHLAPQLANQQSQLNARLQTTQSQNAALFETILAQQREIESLVEALEDTIRDLEDANRALDGELPGLRQIMRDMELEMSGM